VATESHFAEVDALMVVSDDIKAKINHGRTTQARLLESVLYEALHSTV
jgi:hypothetical protein